MSFVSFATIFSSLSELILRSNSGKQFAAPSLWLPVVREWRRFAA
jgi:hypothetical protein